MLYSTNKKREYISKQVLSIQKMSYRKKVKQQSRCGHAIVSMAHPIGIVDIVLVYTGRHVFASRLRHDERQNNIQQYTWHECREDHDHGISYAHECGVYAKVFSYSRTDTGYLDVCRRTCQSFVHNVYDGLSVDSCDIYGCISAGACLGEIECLLYRLHLLACHAVRL